jgi:dimeric dUTPase (all-alpha-NTP-PPase superfamily)
MSVPFTMSYKEVYSQETVDKIEELLEDSYALEDIIEFIDANSEADFRTYYEDYVSVGENHSYGAVDAFIEEFGLHVFTQSNFENSYLGQYDSKADYAEQYTSDVYCVELPSFVEVDWEATFDNLDVVFSANGYVFNTQF